MFTSSSSESLDASTRRIMSVFICSINERSWSTAIASSLPTRRKTTSLSILVDKESKTEKPFLPDSHSGRIHIFSIEHVPSIVRIFESLWCLRRLGFQCSLLLERFGRWCRSLEQRFNHAFDIPVFRAQQ